MTITRFVTLGGRIPVTVETRRKHEEPKVTTVSRGRWRFEVWAGEGGDHTMGGGVGSPGPGTRGRNFLKGVIKTG